MSRRVIEGSHARLRGLQETMTVMAEHSLPESFGLDYEAILRSLKNAVDDPFDGFDVTPDMTWNEEGHTYFNRVSLKSEISQLIQYLEAVHRARDRIVEVGSAYNLISDQELRSRCSDLLSASDHFDWVINQATQVLEERLRLKVPSLSSEIGLSLVGKAINSDPTKSIIIFSNTSSEQEGYAAIFRGLVGAFRNPAHHSFMKNVSREQALQICAFVDNMLSALNPAQING